MHATIHPRREVNHTQTTLTYVQDTHTHKHTQNSRALIYTYTYTTTRLHIHTHKQAHKAHFSYLHVLPSNGRPPGKKEGKKIRPHFLVTRHVG